MLKLIWIGNSLNSKTGKPQVKLGRLKIHRDDLIIKMSDLLIANSTKPFVSPPLYITLLFQLS